MYTPQQWIGILRSVRNKKPYSVVEVSQGMVFDYQNHLSGFFKKSVMHNGQRLRVRDARVFEYSVDHPSELWVKYSLNENDTWHKFSIMKKGSSYVSFPIEPAYLSPLPISPEKVHDIKKLVYKYVPHEFRQFYDELIALNTSESDSL